MSKFFIVNVFSAICFVLVFNDSLSATMPRVGELDKFSQEDARQWQPNQQRQRQLNGASEEGNSSLQSRRDISICDRKEESVILPDEMAKLKDQDASGCFHQVLKRISYLRNSLNSMLFHFFRALSSCIRPQVNSEKNVAAELQKNLFNPMNFEGNKTSGNLHAYSKAVNDTLNNSSHINLSLNSGESSPGENLMTLEEQAGEVNKTIASQRPDLPCLEKRIYAVADERAKNVSVERMNNLIIDALNEKLKEEEQKGPLLWNTEHEVFQALKSHLGIAQTEDIYYWEKWMLQRKGGNAQADSCCDYFSDREDSKNFSEDHDDNPLNDHSPQTSISSITHSWYGDSSSEIASDDDDGELL